MGTKPKRKRPDHEAVFAFQCAAAHLPDCVRQYRFHPIRLWRFDFAWPTHLLAVEIDGGLFSHGGHNRGGYIRETMEKSAAAMMLGWRILRVAPDHVKDGRALQWTEAILRVTAPTRS